MNIDNFWLILRPEALTTWAEIAPWAIITLSNRCCRWSYRGLCAYWGSLVVRQATNQCEEESQRGKGSLKSNPKFPSARWSIEIGTSGIQGIPELGPASREGLDGTASSPSRIQQAFKIIYDCMMMGPDPSIQV